jgi:hypothetical protein
MKDTKKPQKTGLAMGGVAIMRHGDWKLSLSLDVNKIHIAGLPQRRFMIIGAKFGRIEGHAVAASGQ